jgi:hypothetical protein
MVGERCNTQSKSVGTLVCAMAWSIWWNRPCVCELVLNFWVVFEYCKHSKKERFESSKHIHHIENEGIDQKVDTVDRVVSSPSHLIF